MLSICCIAPHILLPVIIRDDPYFLDWVIAFGEIACPDCCKAQFQACLTMHLIKVMHLLTGEHFVTHGGCWVRCLGLKIELQVMPGALGLLGE